MDLQDVESATILAFKYMLDGSELLKGDASRHAFAHFVHLVSTNHPVERWALPPVSVRVSPQSQLIEYAFSCLCDASDRTCAD